MVQKTVGKTKLCGFSLAGEETVVAAPELNVCFDVGRAPREIISIDTICISHGHQDHAAGLAYYFSQRGFVGNSPGRVLLHRSLAQPAQRLMDVWSELEGHHSPGEIIAMDPGDECALRRDLIVRSYAVSHAAGALGYSVIEVRHKLKPEYADRSGPQLVELKRQGVEIERRNEVSLISCTGDTAAGAFLELDHVRDAELLLLECTFFDREHVIRARAGRHIHVCDLRDIMRTLRCPHVVLTHVTRRTDLRTAKRILTDAVDRDDLDRLSFLMDRPRRDHPRRPDWSPPQAASGVERPAGATDARPKSVS